MFTGLVERTGRVVSLTSSDGTALMSSITQLIVDAGKGFDTQPGDSVSVNGCCLTVTSNKVQMLAFDLSRETLNRTSLGTLHEGSEVNLERAMRLGDRLGGHLVSGHVDGLGEVTRIQKKPDGWDLSIRLSAPLTRYVIPKGSICLDGISLTVNTVVDLPGGATDIGLMLIPTTVSMTSFKHLREGQPVNVEVDQVGKYIERFAAAHVRG